jgi:hypothetical protein
LKDYAAMDVIVMIDIYERLKTKISEVQEWFVEFNFIEKKNINQTFIYLGNLFNS